MRLLTGITHEMSRVLMFVACVLIVVMAVHVTADVLMKYLFNRPIVGTLEFVSSYYMVVVSFAPLAYAQWHRDHLIVELATQGLSKRTIRIIDGVVYIGCIALLTLYIWHTTLAAIEKTRLGESWQTGFYELPVWPTRWLLPISLAAMGLCMIVQVATGFREEADRPEDVPTA